MNNFNSYFSQYTSVDDPPIITEGYNNVKNWYASMFSSEPIQESPIIDSEFMKVKDKEKTDKTIKMVLSPQYKSNLIKSKKHDNKVIQYFLDKGLNEIQARGIYGNLMQESGLDPNAVSKDGHYSYGIAQWTGSRKEKLFKKYGTNPTLDQQLDFLWEELNTTHKSALEGLKNSHTILDATKSFMDKFEKPHPKYANLKARVNFAFNINEK